MSRLGRLLGGSSQFRRNFRAIASANVMGQVVGVATLPILSRLFTPEHFGILTTYTVAQSVGLSVVTGRVDWIVPNAPSVRKARRLVQVGLGIVVTVVLATLLLLAVSPARAEGLTGLSGQRAVLRMLPLGLLAGGAQLLLQSWNVFRNELRDVALAKVAQAVSTILLSLLLGLVWATSTALVAAYVMGFVVAGGLLLARAKRHDGGLTDFRIRASLLTLRSFGRQILSNSVLSLVNVLTTAGMMILLVYWYDTQVVGWYGLVFRVATAPIGLVTTALVQSFWADAAALAKRDPEELRRFYLGSVARLSVVGAVAVVVALFAPLYVPPIFGREEWSGAGRLLAAVSPFLFGMIVFSPTTHLIVYAKAHWQTVADAATMIVGAVSFSVLASAGYPAWTAVLANSVVLLLGYLVRFALHLRANRGHVVS